MEESQKQFNAKAEFVVKIMSGGEKSCTLRFPSDDEWAARAAKQKTVRHFLGRGQSTVDTAGAEKIDAELFERVRVDKDGPPFDDAEASHAIGRLERCRVEQVDREGDGYRVTLRVPGAVTEHVLRAPTKAEQLTFSRQAINIRDGRREQITSVNLQPSGEFYDRLHKGHKGYADVIPIIHKDVVLVEVLSQIQALEDDFEGEV